MMKEMMVNGTLNGSVDMIMMINCTLKRLSARRMMIVGADTLKTKNSTLTHDGCTTK